MNISTSLIAAAHHFIRENAAWCAAEMHRIAPCKTARRVTGPKNTHRNTTAELLRTMGDKIYRLDGVKPAWSSTKHRYVTGLDNLA
jgi:hypothetical protein